jgi:hypothetical protein
MPPMMPSREFDWNPIPHLAKISPAKHILGQGTAIHSLQWRLCGYSLGLGSGNIIVASVGTAC